jgi:hypothetical protein
MADEHVRWRNAGTLQQLMQIARNRVARTRTRSRIAPTETSAIVPAGSQRFRNLRLDQKPAVAGHSAAAIEHDRRLSFTRTEDVERSPSDIHRSADLWKASAVSTIADDLIHRAGKEKGGQRKGDSLHSPTLRQSEEVTINAEAAETAEEKSFEICDLRALCVRTSWHFHRLWEHVGASPAM